MNERKGILKEKDRVPFSKKCFVNSAITLNILMMISITNMDKSFKHTEGLSKLKKFNIWLGSSLTSLLLLKALLVVSGYEEY